MFNDANMTGNYAVLHAKASKQFQSQFSAEQLSTAFGLMFDATKL
jgi:hypothetical protein